MDLNLKFDAVVVGAGHAGIEAARALSARGKKTLLVTLDLKRIGAMSCNPAIGGVAKGHLVYEIDALGGLMPLLADSAAIQTKRLNMNRGPAVRSTRSQCDKDVYSARAIQEVKQIQNLSLFEGELSRFYWDENGAKILACELSSGQKISTRALVITAGTFMQGLMFCGSKRSHGGRFGDQASKDLSKSILACGHKLKRLKTGTPARLKGKTIDFSGLEKQWGDDERRYFSLRSPTAKLPQLCCYLTYTSSKTHELIAENFHQSPLFSGEIQGVGPRYCPSIEDKVKRFAERERHQVFLEPEGLNGDSIYPNGLSTSLPEEVQLGFLRSIKGLERVELYRPGYAVEYDSIDPRDLKPSLMSKYIEGLFFAGQVNRTSGYEEAAAQGLWAGINASLYLDNKEQLYPLRSRSYIETLVDDLVTNGSDEPYRLFTSRSEHRLVLREDNAAERLFDLAESLGLLTAEQLKVSEKLVTEGQGLREKLRTERVRIDKDRVVSLFELLKRPEHSLESLGLDGLDSYDWRFLEKVEIEAKYAGYLQRQEDEINELKKIQSWRLSPNLSIRQVPGLSAEVIEKYEKQRPGSVYELSRISGVTPSALLTIARFAGQRPVSRETI